MGHVECAVSGVHEPLTYSGAPRAPRNGHEARSGIARRPARDAFPNGCAASASEDLLSHQDAQDMYRSGRGDEDSAEESQGLP